MFRYVFLAVAAYIVYIIAWTILSFRNNLAKAKKSGLPYVIVPIFWLDRRWLVTHRLWLRILRKLPKQYTEWVDFVLPDTVWENKYAVFEKAGHDTWLAVSPGTMHLWTAEPAVINQITTRRNDFPKHSSMYKGVNIYGDNVVTAEGQKWRHHRKAVSPPFTEKNNQLVWTESIEQCGAMLKSWVGSDGKGNITIDRIMDDTMRLSLNVISNAGFGRKIQWPVEDSKVVVDKGDTDSSKIKNEEEDVGEGHTMSYVYAIHCLLDTILLQFLLPRWALEKLPFKVFKKSQQAFVEWGQYMSEMVADRKQQWQQKTVKNEEGLDILAQLVKDQLADQNTKGSTHLNDSEILGNMFVIILAGHETAANSLHFAILLLALHPPIQRKLQKELDGILQGRSPNEWDYERDLPGLFGGLTGAILAEELRLIPPVINIPKSTVGVSDQSLTVEGKKCIVPSEIDIALSTVAVHRNPKYWPTLPPKYPGGHPVHPISNLDNDLEEFNPERWLLSGDEARASNRMKEQLDTEGIGVNVSSDTSESMFKPVPGSYLPFSEGFRSCLGRRFAQVEVIAVLAVLFQNYSVELAVDDHASDTELAKMNDQEKGEVWQKAAEDCRDKMLWGCATIITLQMRRGTVKVRFVKRGEEVFKDDVDEVVRRRKFEELGITGVKGDFIKDDGWRSWDQPGRTRTRAKGTLK